MKQIIYLILLTFIAASCTDKTQTTGNKLAFDSIVVEEKTKLLPNKPDSIPYATVNINFVYPKSFRSEQDLKKIQSVFYDEVFGKKQELFTRNDIKINYKDAVSPQDAVKKNIENFMSFYRESNKESYQWDKENQKEEFPYYKYMYSSSVSNKIIFENDSLISISAFYDDYYGGMHSAFIVSNVTINLNSLSTIKEADIFVPGYKEPFAKIIRKKLLKFMKDEVEDSETDENILKQYFNNYDNIYSNNNFYMDAEGLHYVYNIYEIAAYASGTFEVFIPYNEVSDLLKPDVMRELLPAVNPEKKTKVGTNKTDDFPSFLSQFLNDCWWNKNFNTLLRDGDKTLAKYIDPKMDVRRYYAPGATAYLAGRDENFGFAEYDDFDTKPKKAQKHSLQLLDEDFCPCDFDFGFEHNSPVYYKQEDNIPDIYTIEDNDNIQVHSVKIPYPDATIMTVYLPNSFNYPLALYFIQTPSGWKLAFVDETLCSG